VLIENEKINSKIKKEKEKSNKSLIDFFNELNKKTSIRIVSLKN